MIGLLRKQRQQVALLELARIELESIHIELDRLGVARHQEDGGPFSVSGRLRLYAGEQRPPAAPHSLEL